MSPAAITRLFGDHGDVLTDTEAQLIFVSHAMLVMGTVLISPLIADLALVFAVSEVEAGLFIIVFTGTLLVTLPVAGIVADRFGRRASVVPGVALFGIAGAAIAFTDTFEFALALRMVQAVGVALSKPVLVALLGDLYSGARETTAQGFRVATDSLFSIVTPVLAGVLFLVSWRVPFLVYGLAVPIAIWLWIALPTLESGDSRPVTAYFRDLASFMTDRIIGLLMVSFFVRQVMNYGMFTYISVLAIREAGMAVVMVGLLLSVRSVLKLMSSSQAGRLTERTDAALVCLVGFAMLGAGLFMMGAVPTVFVLFVGMMLFGLGDGLLSPTQKSLVNQLSPPTYRSSSMSAALTFQNIGKTAGPLGVGIVLGLIGPAWSFLLLGAVGGILGVGLLAAIRGLTVSP